MPNSSRFPKASQFSIDRCTTENWRIPGWGCANCCQIKNLCVKLGFLKIRKRYATPIFFSDALDALFVWLRETARFQHDQTWHVSLQPLPQSSCLHAYASIHFHIVTSCCTSPHNYTLVREKVGRFQKLKGKQSKPLFLWNQTSA